MRMILPTYVAEALIGLVLCAATTADVDEKVSAAIAALEDARTLLSQLDEGDPEPDPDPPTPPPAPGEVPLLDRWTVYVMQPIWKAKAGEIQDSVLRQADGINIRVKWAQIEPSPGRFDLSHLKKHIDRCERFGKLAQITVLDFDDAPRWLGQSGAQSLTLRNDGKSVRCWPQWDPVVQQRYRLMVRHLVANLSFKNVTHWHAPGGDNAELHYKQFQGFYNNFNAARQVDGYLACTRALIEETADVEGRGVIVSVNMGDFNQKWVADAVERCKREFKGRIGFQMNSLSAKTSLTYRGFTWTKQAAAEGFHAGFEQVSLSGIPRYGGTLAKSLETANRTDGQWLQIYRSDIPAVMRAVN